MRVIVAIVFIVAMSAVSQAQQVSPAQVYAIGWQPVAVPGQLIAVPRPLYVTNWLWGPRVYFVPQIQSQPQQPQPLRPLQ